MSNLKIINYLKIEGKNRLETGHSKFGTRKRIIFE